MRIYINEKRLDIFGNDALCSLNFKILGRRLGPIQKASYQTQTRLNAHIDWNWARRWLQTKRVLDVSRFEDLSLHQDLQDLRLIDVQSMSIEGAPAETKFVSLSYTWGGNSKDFFRCLRAMCPILRDLDL